MAEAACNQCAQFGRLDRVTPCPGECRCSDGGRLGPPEIAGRVARHQLAQTPLAAVTRVRRWVPLLQRLKLLACHLLRGSDCGTLPAGLARPGCGAAAPEPG